MQLEAYDIFRGDCPGQNGGPKSREHTMRAMSHRAVEPTSIKSGLATAQSSAITPKAAKSKEQVR
ncbi:hypothetical protein IZU99_07780 [Oscillospiraceae bacterium CM]|nr:hypothetical protein IZU99_07780 [Oscillospiraceae bacterium CM]